MPNKEIELEHRASKKGNGLAFLFMLAFLSTVTAPIGSRSKSILDSIFSVIPIANNSRITDEFYMYNIIAIASVCLLVGLLVQILISSGSRKLSLSLSVWVLFLWTVLQVVYCLLYQEYTSSLVFPILFFVEYLYFNKFDFDDHFDRLVIIFGIANAVLIIIQFLYFSSLTNLTFKLLRRWRPPGFFPDATQSAIYLSVTFAFLVFKRPVAKFRYLACIAIVILACLLNGSRNAYVLVLVAFGLFLLRNKSGFQIILIMTAVALIVGFLYLSIDLKWLDNFLYDSTRDTRKQIALRLFREKPIFGTGLTQYAQTASGYGFGSTVHNIYAAVLCKYGIVGFTLFCFPFVLGIIKGYKVDRLGMCILIIIAFGGYVSGIETSLPIQLVWYYAYSKVLCKS